MASVMIIGWTRRQATPSPLTRPIAVVSDQRRRAIGDEAGRIAWPGDSSGTATALTVTMAATDRSMPPAMTTKVWPDARRGR